MITDGRDNKQLDKLLLQLQTGTLYADNTEPAMTNNRNIALQAISSLIDQRVVEELERLGTEGRTYDGYVEDISNRLKELKASKKTTEDR